MINTSQSLVLENRKSVFLLSNIAYIVPLIISVSINLIYIQIFFEVFFISIISLLWNEEPVVKLHI